MFTGHPSLRCGDAVHFMEVWGTSNKNSVIFTGECTHVGSVCVQLGESQLMYACMSIDPEFDYMHALAPYQPLNMKVLVVNHNIVAVLTCT